MIETVLLIVLVCVALGLIGLVLIQQGKGADAGASFGGGGSQTVFGGSGSGNFLTKSSWFLAAVFFVVCVALAYIARERAAGGPGIDFAAPEQAQEQVIEADVPEFEGDAIEQAPAADVPQMPGEAEEVVAPEQETGEAAEAVQPASEGEGGDEADTQPSSTN